MLARILLAPLLALAAFAGGASAAASAPAAASVADYERRQRECFDAPGEACFARLEQRCQALGGRWGGRAYGRGRSPGCSLPTRDAGKSCTQPAQCQSACLVDTAAARPGAAAPCRCARWTRVDKGGPIGWCSARGVEWITVD